MASTCAFNSTTVIAATALSMLSFCIYDTLNTGVGVVLTLASRKGNVLLTNLLIGAGFIFRVFYLYSGLFSYSAILFNARLAIPAWLTIISTPAYELTRAMLLIMVVRLCFGLFKDLSPRLRISMIIAATHCGLWSIAMMVGNYLFSVNRTAYGTLYSIFSIVSTYAVTLTMLVLLAFVFIRIYELVGGRRATATAQSTRSAQESRSLFSEVDAWKNIAGTLIWATLSLIGCIVYTYCFASDAGAIPGDNAPYYVRNLSLFSLTVSNLCMQNAMTRALMHDMKVLHAFFSRSARPTAAASTVAK